MVEFGPVSHVIYRVWDRERAAAFLVDALGGTLQPRGNIVYVVFGDTLVEMVWEDPDSEADAESERYTFGLVVDDLEAAIGELEVKGAKVVRRLDAPSSFWGRQAVITVPGGTPIALREWRAPDGPHFMGWRPEL
jgi:predicted enzyme related to lactoylglutathione lyase